MADKRAKLINDIEWGEPVLPIVRDPEWEAEVKADMGMVPDLMTRVSRSPWLRKACLKWPRYSVTKFPKHLKDIGALVTAQENACRFCYGMAKSQMRLFGYSEKLISNIERETQLAEMDEKDLIFIQFCRNLARSNPRPPKADRDKLINLGFTPLAVSEMAFHIANQCFINRVATFIASPPMYELEKMSTSFFGRIMRPLIARKIRSQAWTPAEPLTEDKKSFPGLVQALDGLPAAAVIQEGLEGAFSSEVLSMELKVLMFAVVARSLECSFCENATRQMAEDIGFSETEFANALSSLNSPRLSGKEGKILSWTRETVHFQTGPMQKQVHALSREVDEEMLLESIGVAALANTAVRLAVLIV
jgi:alkylhydroperoxidase family enzyme